MNLHGIFLPISDVIEKITHALPPGHELSCLAAAVEAGKWSSDSGLFRILRIPAWVGEVGTAIPESLPAEFGNRGLKALLWLGCADKAVPAEWDHALQLLIDAPKGQYRIDYLQAGTGILTGTEMATASPLVLAPPPGNSCVAVIMDRFPHRPSH